MTILLAIVCLVAGVLCGQFIPREAVGLIDSASDVLLNLLLLSVGITVGANKLIFRKLKEFNLRVLYIPLGIIAGSLLFGTAAGLLMGLPLNTSSAISSGLGWYSLSGIMLKDLAGAQIGTMTFLSNIFREIFSFILIPLIATRLGPYTAIAPAAATSEDTTLPILMKYTSEEVAVIAVINGVICSTAVPILVSFTFKVFA
ncbi:lysine exporter LysO family protein [Zongyangia hominis]|uniref:Lysine exporter LysO family protein n=1 Tax=Zongyangia hominis TaxID=2763677 RepID=A0A926EDE8_9FIRM|nr:lysine exporter LysO family protein [Zongyangia hominis]MBC8570159.1 lysine exporter LysO family protein [Zongyangia hominis]